MFVGRRIISTYNLTAAGCGGKGVGGIVVHDRKDVLPDTQRVYVIFDNCACNKPWSGGCNGFAYDIKDETSSHFKWAESDDSEKSCNNEQLCNCTFDIIMTFGCQCGGK